MDIIPLSLRIDFREFCVLYLTLQPIRENFEGAGFVLTEKTLPQISGARRSLIEQYFASCDWTKLRDAQKLLDVMSLILSQSYSGSTKAALRDMCLRHDLIVDNNQVHFSGNNIGADVKNLIFAAIGPKPEIVLTDALTNDIQIVRNREYCLIYDRPLVNRGLMWKDLVEWWIEESSERPSSVEEAQKSLYVRLLQSLASLPEKLLFKTYFKCFRSELGDKLPALVPQVYLHYDPYSLKVLANGKRLLRQRMDFLLLLSQQIRIVIEVDGQQHYSVNGSASPQLYSEMVAEDRRIRLAGYEVYRFGGYEFRSEDSGELVVREFFKTLLDNKLA